MAGQQTIAERKFTMGPPKISLTNPFGFFAVLVKFWEWENFTPNHSFIYFIIFFFLFFFFCCGACSRAMLSLCSGDFLGEGELKSEMFPTSHAGGILLLCNLNKPPDPLILSPFLHLLLGKCFTAEGEYIDQTFPPNPGSSSERTCHKEADRQHLPLFLDFMAHFMFLILHVSFQGNQEKEVHLV